MEQSTVHVVKIFMDFDGAGVHVHNHYVEIWKVAGSNPCEVIGFFFLIYLILPDSLWSWGLLSL
jgi:hypothetical protein